MARKQINYPVLEPPHVPPLENGDRLNAQEFLPRYEAMPELKEADQ